MFSSTEEKMKFKLRLDTYKLLCLFNTYTKS